MREVKGFAGALAASLALLASGDMAGAATLKANYQLQGGRTSQVPGAPDLVDIGPGNRFVTEEVDGVTRQVLAFPNSDDVVGGGRLVVFMDVDWLDAGYRGSNWAKVAQNVALFLSGSSIPPAPPVDDASTLSQLVNRAGNRPHHEERSPSPAAPLP